MCYGVPLAAAFAYESDTRTEMVIRGTPDVLVIFTSARSYLPLSSNPLFPSSTAWSVGALIQGAP